MELLLLCISCFLFYCVIVFYFVIIKTAISRPFFGTGAMQQGAQVAHHEQVISRAEHKNECNTSPVTVTQGYHLVLGENQACCVKIANHDVRKT